MNAGRLGLGAVLKRWAELAGRYDPQLLDGIQPTVQLADLATELPFALPIPWHAQFTVGAVVARFGCVEILFDDTRVKDWIEFEYIQNLGATFDASIRIISGASGEITANQTSVTPEPRRLRATTDLGGLGIMTMRHGTAAAALPGPDYRLTQGERLPLPFAIGASQNANDYTLLVVGHPTANTAVDLVIGGRLHLTGAR